MTSLVRPASSALDALAAFNAVRESLRACKASAPNELQLALQDAYDNVCRIQSEYSGGAARIPLSAVEALGLLRVRLNADGSDDFSFECGIATARLRHVLVSFAEGGRHISITSESYLRRLLQLLTALTRPQR